MDSKKSNDQDGHLVIALLTDLIELFKFEVEMISNHNRYKCD